LVRAHWAPADQASVLALAYQYSDAGALREARRLRCEPGGYVAWPQAVPHVG
jgi:hypothetical protein